MSEFSDENEDLSTPAQDDADILSILKKMQQQLNYLEKKIDTLVGQSPERSFQSREKRFSKPFRPSFGGGAHYGKRDFHRGPRREGFSHDRSSHNRPGEDSFSNDRPRERSFGQERSFDRKPGSGPRGFGHGNKPFFRHRKGPRS